MAKKVNNLKLNQNHLKVLDIFTRGYDKGHYIREIERLLKISSRTSQLILNDLEKKSILESTLKGKTRIFKIKPCLISKEYFIFCELYKRIYFLEKNLLIKEIIEKINPFLKGMVLIFGSYAKGLQKKQSDFDIFIIGNYEKNKIKEIAKTYGIEINIKQYSLKIFEKELHKDILIKEVLDNHVIILGVEQFIDKILQWTK